MGSGIATSLILSNMSVLLKEVNSEYLLRGIKLIEGSYHPHPTQYFHCSTLHTLLRKITLLFVSNIKKAYCVMRKSLLFTLIFYLFDSGYCFHLACIHFIGGALFNNCIDLSCICIRSRIDCTTLFFRHGC